MGSVFRKIFKVNFLRNPTFFFAQICLLNWYNIAQRVHVSFMLAKLILFFRWILKNFRRKHKSGLASIKIAGILSKISSTSIAEKFEQKKGGVSEIIDFEYFSKIRCLKIIQRASKEDGKPNQNLKRKLKLD